MRLVTVSMALALAGCAAQMAPGADQVRQIGATETARCQFIRMVQVEGGLVYSSKTEAHRDMLNKLRNETLHAGGNAFAERQMVVERGFSLPFAQADAYRCS